MKLTLIKGSKASGRNPHLEDLESTKEFLFRHERHIKEVDAQLNELKKKMAFPKTYIFPNTRLQPSTSAGCPGELARQVEELIDMVRTKSEVDNKIKPTAKQLVGLLRVVLCHLQDEYPYSPGKSHPINRAFRLLVDLVIKCEAGLYQPARKRRLSKGAGKEV